MSSNSDIAKKLLAKSTVVKSKNLNLEDIESLLLDYQDALLVSIIERGSVQVTPDVRLLLIKLKDRQYVLRGTSYRNSRKYKLKAEFSYNMYNKINEYYSSLLVE